MFPTRNSLIKSVCNPQSTRRTFGSSQGKGEKERKKKTEIVLGFNGQSSWQLHSWNVCWELFAKCMYWEQIYKQIPTNGIHECFL